MQSLVMRVGEVDHLKKKVFLFPIYDEQQKQSFQPIFLISTYQILQIIRGLKLLSFPSKKSFSMKLLSGNF